jgi:hypothetical protein
MARPADRVVAFYNHRGAAEHHIKEGKNAVTWCRAAHQRDTGPDLRPAAGCRRALRFARLAATHDLPVVSKGMSADFETAIIYDAIWVSVGTVIFAECQKVGR